MANHNGVYYSSSSGLNLRTAATTRINISTGGVIQFNSAYTFPTSDGSANTVLLTNGSGALSFGTVPNAGLTNSSLTVTAGNGLANGGSVSLGGSVTLNVGAGTGIVVNANDVALDYAGTDNFIDSATNLEGTDISGLDTIVYHDATDNNVKKGLVSDLPFSNNSGTVTSVAISGSDGIDVDSGSPITTSGTIALGLSNVPNSSLANSSVTIGSTSISLGGTSTTLAGLTSVAATTFTGALSGNASTASKWANARTITLGTDLSGSVSIDGSANVSLNASIVAGAVGSTELAANAVTTVKITDANVTNAKLANSSFTVNAPSGSDPVVPLGGTLNFTSSDSSVIIAGNSTTDTIDLTVGNAVNTYVTGGTFTSGTLSLGLNDGSSTQDISGFWSSIPNSALANSAVTVTAGNGLANGGSVSLGGSVTLNVGAAIGGGITVGANDISLDTSSSRNVDHDSVSVLAGTGLSGGGTISVNRTLSLDTTSTRNVDHSSVSISAGTGLSGGGTIAASRTLSLDYAGTDNFIDSATNLEGTAIALTDTIVYHDATDNNVKKGLVSDLPFTNTSGTVTSVAITGTDGIDVDSGSPITTSGTITLGLSNVPNASLANSSVTVTAGSGLANGGSVSLGGSVTLNVGAGTGITVNTDDVALDYLGTNNFIDSATNLEGTAIAVGDTIVYHDATDNNVKKGFVSDLPFTNNAGTVTSVGITAGALIDVTGGPITSSGNITVDVDLSELTTSTSDGDGDYFAVVDTSNAQRKLTKANILLSGFNDDISLFKNNGSLTSTRTVSQATYDIGFGANVDEQTLIYKTTSTSNTNARLFVEGDDNYQNVLELYGSAPSTALVEGFDVGQASVFRVDNMGNLTAVSKAFDIPHPNPEKKAEGMRLKHGNLEGPEHGVYVRGRQIDDKEIELPDYWLDLVDPDTITVQLTSIGSHQNLYVKEIKDNVVYIGNGNLFSNKIDCYYYIQAERKDIDKITVEYTR